MTEGATVTFRGTSEFKDNSILIKDLCGDDCTTIAKGISYVAPRRAVPSITRYTGGETNGHLKLTFYHLRGFTCGSISSIISTKPGDVQGRKGGCFNPATVDV